MIPLANSQAISLAWSWRDLSAFYRIEVLFISALAVFLLKWISSDWIEVCCKLNGSSVWDNSSIGHTVGRLSRSRAVQGINVVMWRLLVGSLSVFQGVRRGYSGNGKCFGGSYTWLWGVAKSPPIYNDLCLWFDSMSRGSRKELLFVRGLVRASTGAR